MEFKDNTLKSYKSDDYKKKQLEAFLDRMPENN